MVESLEQRRAKHCQRAKDAHRLLLEEAAQRGARWQSDDVPTRVERVIIGGGLAATLAWATRSRAEGACVVLAGAEEPWWSRREHRLGQPASELVSEGFVLQPHDFVDDIDGFAPASALADAIAVTAHAHGLPLVLGCSVDRPIERTPDGHFAVHVGERRIEAEHVDVAVGLGPPRRLRDADGHATIVTEDEERELLNDGRMIFGQDQWRQPARSGKVLVIGGGATAAWNVELALRAGADVKWLAAESASEDRDQRLKIRAIDEHLATNADLGETERRSLVDQRARLAAFHKADLPRNRAVFESPGVELWVGSAQRLSPLPEAVEAKLLQGSELRTHTFDQVIVSIGQDDRASEASASLVGGLPMTWLENDGQVSRPGGPSRKPSGRIVGACMASDPARLRCLGAPLLTSRAWQQQLDKSRPQKSLGGDPLRARLEKQAAAAPTHSKGIEGAVFHVGANVVLANGVALEPGLGAERYALLASTFQASQISGLRQDILATSSGVGG